VKPTQNGEEDMNENRLNCWEFTKCVLFFSIISSLSCTSTSVIRLEGSDFEKNLPGLWEGKWSYGSRWDYEEIKIIKIDGNKVHLTGYNGGGGGGSGSEEVYGRIENSTLFLTWPGTAGGVCKEEYNMKRNNSNNLILDGQQKCGGFSAKVRLKKIE
jgi:hypothetical protein